MSSNELYDKVVGIDFDALAERTGFPVEDLRALDRECAEDGIRTLMAHAEALAARVEEREAQLRLIAPVVSAALEMFQWEGSTDYPDGDPEVIKRRRAFRDALYHLDDLHYDELDFLDDFQPGDLPDTKGSTR